MCERSNEFNRSTVQLCRLRYIYLNYNSVKPHVEKLVSSDITGSNELKMAQVETFHGISRNVEVRALWFSELRTMVKLASYC